MKRILVIEDEPAIRESILEILNSEDFYALGAENGQVGVKIATEFQPNLILCDVMMPELNGYGVLQQLQQDTKTATIPFVFLTAKSDKHDFRQGMNLGADDYLTKPFTHSTLLQTIVTRLNKQMTIEQESQQRLDELRHSISLSLPHELSTPLNVIGGFSQMLMEDAACVSPEEIMEMAKLINMQSKRLHRLVQNFLLITKLEVLATNPEQLTILRKEKLEDTETIIKISATLKAQQFNREADLRLNLASASAKISEPKFKKIVEELLDNAFKFSSEGAQVQVFTSCLDGHFILHIIDYGHGMTDEQICKVGAYMQFDRDMQEQQGNGLGLTIARRLTQLHGGELSIESIPGKQTIVRVSIPC